LLWCFDAARRALVVAAAVVVVVVSVVGVVVVSVVDVVEVVEPGYPGSPGPVHAHATPPPAASVTADATAATVLR
jgi:hypothetical protein